MRKSKSKSEIDKVIEDFKRVVSVDWNKAKIISVKGFRKRLETIKEKRLDPIFSTFSEEEGVEVVYAIDADGNPVKVVVRYSVDDFINELMIEDNYVEEYIEQKIPDLIEAYGEYIHSSSLARLLVNTFEAMKDVCVKAGGVYDLSPEEADMLDKFSKQIVKMANLLRRYVRKALESYAAGVAFGFINDPRWYKLLKEEEKR